MILPLISLTGLLVTTSHAQQQGIALTPQVSDTATSLLELTNTPGLSVGVVHLQNGSATFEFGVWGNRTEAGDKVTSDVSTLWMSFESFDNC